MAKAKYTMQKDGYYRTKVWNGTYNPDGSKKRVYLTSKKSSADLERKVNELKQKVREGQIVQNTDMSFLDYSRFWRKTYKSLREEGTIAMYDNVIERHFVTLGGIPLRDIRKIHFQQVINEAGNKPRTCQQIALTFRKVIRSAMQDKYLPATAYTDICSNVDIPIYIAREKRTLLPEEVAAIKKADFTPKERCFVYLLYGCGLRRGEALAQTNLTVNLKKREITVNKSVAFKGNSPYLKSTKNGKIRILPIPGYLVDYLKKYLPTINGPYLFTTRNGTMMSKSSFDKMWASILRKINAAAGGTDNLKVIYGLTAHVFRHNYCTSLCYQIPAISIKKIAYLLGDTEKMVLEVYNHVMEERENPEQVVNDAVSL